MDPRSCDASITSRTTACRWDSGLRRSKP